MPKRTMQVEVWSDDDVKVAEFINATRLMAQAVFGADKQNVVFTGPGVKTVRNVGDQRKSRSAINESRGRGVGFVLRG